MKKTILLIAAGIAMATTALAAPVDAAKAHQVAVTFWNSHRPLDVKPVVTLQHLSFAELQHQYVFADGENGFVIVAADDRVRPVLGYSFDSPFPTRLHSELRYWLGTYEEQIAYAMTMADAPANPRWRSLVAGEVPAEPVSLQQVAALCTTRWNQDDPFNRLCPYDSVYGDRSVVGCVATAMAQIMKRWNHPSCGTGSHTYTHFNDDLDWSYGELSADFEHTTYLWQLMPDYVFSTTTDVKAKALSTLSYHCGVAVEMMYGPTAIGGSGAYSSCGYWASACAENAFSEYFKYSPDIQFHQRNYYSADMLIPDSVWLAMVDAELAAGRPMYYSGSDYTGGHAFVLDGSDLDTCYHFNWGWGGYGDGFYALNNLAPGGGGAGGNSTYTFNYDQGALFGIVPIPEVFDTVDVYDTICTNYDEYTYYEYPLPVASCDTHLRYLDTIVRLHLHVNTSHTLTYSQGYGRVTNSQFISLQYCQFDPVVMPECEFTRDGYDFIGWSRSRMASSDEPIYQPGDTVRLYGNTTLYARWRDTNDVVGLVEVEDAQLMLWPNPTTGEVTLTYGQASDAQIDVLDMLGRSMLHEEVALTEAGNVKISLAGLPSGIYMVRLRTEDGVFNRRIIKQ